MTSYLNSRKVPPLIPAEAHKYNIGYDPSNGYLMWEWESDLGYRFLYRFDFQGIYISLYDETDGEYYVIATEPYYAPERAADWTNQIIERIENGENPLENLFFLDNPTPVFSESVNQSA